jgi:subtilisin-like proprotein convertase family protein
MHVRKSGSRTIGTRGAVTAVTALVVLFGLAVIAPPAGASAPLPPAGCTPSGTTFTQSTPVAIPTGPAVVTSTLVVSGAGSYLQDVDLTTFITHTFPGDLDITVTSPAGTVVTLTTDNAGTNDDVFNGTVWDDDANPAGQVPYTTNNGLVTDHAYAVGVLASPLVPEEALGAFIGENPNGTWTLTISDDSALDGGSLNSWSLNLSTLTAAPTGGTTVSAAQSTPVAIPTGPAVVTSTIVVAGAPTYLADANLTTFITHTFPGDLDITVTSPAGTVVTLTTDNAGTDDDVFNGTVWDDDANPAGQVPYVTNNGLVTDHAYAIGVLASPLVPEEALGAFIGENPNGTWTLTISDDTAADGGSLNSWSLDLTGGGSCLLPTTTTVTSSVNPSTFGQPVTFTAVTCPAVSTPPTPTGTVAFKDGATVLGSGALVAGGGPNCATATFTTSTLSPGAHSITGVYGGDTVYASSTSPVLTQTVNCSSTITGTVGNTSLANGQCLSGATVNGNVTVQPGASVVITNSVIHGNLTANNPGTVRVCGSTVDVNTMITGATGFVQIGGAGCTGNTLKGNLTLSGNKAGLRVADNTVGGNVSITNNKASGNDPAVGGPAGNIVANNTIGNAFTCSGNIPPVSNGGSPNTVTGARGGECAGTV